MPEEEQRPDIGALIRAAITAGQSLKADQAVDKKWLNKVVARLEEVEAFIPKLYKSNSLNNPANMDSLSATAPAVGCTCPPGVRDSQCPIHGAKAA